jgi:hypothetical protein
MEFLHWFFTWWQTTDRCCWCWPSAVMVTCIHVSRSGIARVSTRWKTHICWKIFEIVHGVPPPCYLVAEANKWHMLAKSWSCKAIPTEKMTGIDPTGNCLRGGGSDGVKWPLRTFAHSQGGIFETVQENLKMTSFVVRISKVKVIFFPIDCVRQLMMILIHTLIAHVYMYAKFQFKLYCHEINGLSF